MWKCHLGLVDPPKYGMPAAMEDCPPQVAAPNCAESASLEDRTGTRPDWSALRSSIFGTPGLHLSSHESDIFSGTLALHHEAGLITCISRNDALG